MCIVKVRRQVCIRMQAWIFYMSIMSDLPLEITCVISHMLFPFVTYQKKHDVAALNRWPRRCAGPLPCPCRPPPLPRLSPLSSGGKDSKRHFGQALVLSMEEEECWVCTTRRGVGGGGGEE